MTQADFQAHIALLDAHVEYFSRQIKAIINGMSPTEVLEVFGSSFLGADDFEVICSSREVLEKLLQRASAAAGAVDDQHVAASMELPTGEQSVDSDQSSCVSSLTISR